ncbi:MULTISPECIES: tryptophan synthase subunit alpha [Bacillaceae]|uniref:Tryptophan synthase alpha chain n=1 Tax=Peribacillus huizhouensis TaxID=1501239 RepID=A0ABR6CJ18_9BACI|nr:MULTISPECIES: tryptophan synthase subunit alpha [Bacillaceae]MBA9025015.1 tryptophan synthase alpha chain [Peribacillus huizhouensis]
MGNKSLQETLAELHARQEKAFIPYIMAGDGGLEKLKEDLLRLQNAGATAVELGIPFSDPVADGPIIQLAGKRALAEGVTLKKIIAKLIEIKEEVEIPIIFMAYLNSLLAYGISNFSNDCAKAGVSGCIVPDLPIEEEGILVQDLKKVKIPLIRLVTLTSSQDRIEKIVENAEGFIYAVTVTGITGVRESFEEEVGLYLKRIREASSIPVLAGFGISTAEHVERASLYCDGVIVGSKIIQSLQTENYQEIDELILASKKVIY